jgi:DinB superfamily
MTTTLKSILSHQFEAAFCTLGLCIDRCPEVSWNSLVANLKFCQVAFHTLFFVDYYLERTDRTIREQEFHRAHPGIFRDYEELEDRRQGHLYERDDIRLYLEHCRTKAVAVVSSETAESFETICGFPPKTFSRAELHVYNIRHIQHHAAQLILRLRLDHHIDFPWVGSGWREF